SALAYAWFEKGVALTTMNRDEEAIETFDRALDRYLDRVTAVDLPSGDWRKLRQCMVRALNLKGSVLSSLERVPEGLECCEEAIRRFQDVDDPKVQKSVAYAMRRRARLFGELGRLDKEIAAYDELFTRFGPSADPRIGEVVLNGLEAKVEIYRD